MQAQQAVAAAVERLDHDRRAPREVVLPPAWSSAARRAPPLIPRTDQAVE